MSYLYGSPTPSCRSPRHLTPHITYCPEPLSATILSDKNVSKGGEYIMPRGERILSPHWNPFAEGTGACSIPLHLRVSREGLCVPTCTLLCTRVYTLVYTCVHSSALTERPKGLSPRGSPASQGGQAADDRWGGGREDYHSPRLVVSTAWEGEGRLCLRGQVASLGATCERSLRAALSPSGEGGIGVWLLEYWHLPNTCYICNERYSWSTMHPTRAPSQPLELE